MPKLKISLNGDEYTDQQKKDFWIHIHYLRECPECGAVFSMVHGPQACLASNIKCSYCHTVFWSARYMELGAYPISVDNPPDVERKVINDQDTHTGSV
ncbi:hypothetical protein ES703_115616 [subsurface metagenome]